MGVNISRIRGGGGGGGGEGNQGGHVIYGPDAIYALNYKFSMFRMPCFEISIFYSPDAIYVLK